MLLLVLGAASAQTTTSWEGDGGNMRWPNTSNWDNGVPTSADTAIIDANNPYWPQLNSDVDREVNNLTMRNDAQLDTNGNTLFVYDTFTVSPSGASASVQVSGGGTIDAASASIQADASYSSTLTIGASTTVDADSVSVTGNASHAGTISGTGTLEVDSSMSVDAYSSVTVGALTINGSATVSVTSGGSIQTQ